METIYNDYASWILELSSLIGELIKLNSPLITTNKHVLDVVKYLYDKAIQDGELSSEEETIFTTGFYYLFEQFEQINLMLENHYNNDVVKLNEHAKTLLLLLNVIDLENELFNLNENEESLKPLLDLEDEITSHLINKTEAPQTLLTKIDEVAEKVFDIVNDDYYPIKEIFYDIADEYDLL